MNFSISLKVFMCFPIFPRKGIDRIPSTWLVHSVFRFIWNIKCGIGGLGDCGDACLNVCVRIRPWGTLLRTRSYPPPPKNSKALVGGTQIKSNRYLSGRTIAAIPTPSNSGISVSYSVGDIRTCTGSPALIKKTRFRGILVLRGTWT